LAKKDSTKAKDTEKLQVVVPVEKLTAAQLRDKIFSAADTKPVAYEVEEWGVTLYIRPIRYNRRADFREILENADDDSVAAQEDFSMSMIIETCEDEDGNKLFTPDDIPMLKQRAMGTIDTLVMRIMDLSGFGQETRRRLRAAT